MPHDLTSCREHSLVLLRSELNRLYEERSRLDAAIRELESVSREAPPAADASGTAESLEFSSELCNLTNWLSA